jgi:opacity protein-like surface antigen
VGANGGWLAGDNGAGTLTHDVTGGAQIEQDNSGFVGAGRLQDVFDADINGNPYPDYVLKEKSIGDQFFGGLQVGYNWQAAGSSFVYGVEGDLGFAEDAKYLASLRARLGIASGQALFYLTGGLAVAEFEGTGFDLYAKANQESEAKILGGYDRMKVGSSGGDMETGFVLGGGVEVKVAPQWSLGVEGLYYVFNDVNSDVEFRAPRNVGAAVTKGELVNSFEREDDVDLWSLRARLSYHLGE